MALTANPRAQAMFETLTSANRYAILYRIGTQRRPKLESGASSNSWTCWPGARPSTRKARNHLGDEAPSLNCAGRAETGRAKAPGLLRLRSAGRDISRGAAGGRGAGVGSRRARPSGGARWGALALLAFAFSSGCASGCGSHRAAGRCPGW